LTDDSTSKAAKIIVRHKIVSVRPEGYVSQHSSTPESRRESSFCKWKRSRGLLALAVKRLDRLHSRTALLKVCHRFLPPLHIVSWYSFLVLCEVSIHVFVHVRVQAKNSNGTTVRTFSKFNLLHGRCTLLPFPSALTSLSVQKE